MTARHVIGLWAFMVTAVLPADGAAVQSKCVAGKNKCAATYLTKLLKCHQLAETPGRSTDLNFDDCIDKARVKLDGGLEPEKGCVEKLESKTPNDCVTVDDTGPIGDVVASCVDSLVSALDPPPLSQAKCGAGKKKCVAKTLKGLLKCHQLAQTPGKPADPNAKACIDKVRLKFDGGPEPEQGCFEKIEAKTQNDCETLDDTAALVAVVEDCVTDLVAHIETPTSTTTSTSTTSTSIASTSSTSSTASSSTTAPTTTSSTAGPTTSSSSTTSASTSTSTTTTTSPVGCGNGTTSGGETCDDGNNSDDDSCPADCRIAACTPLTATQRFVQVRFAPPEGGLVAGLTVLLDYPEGSVDLPGNGTTLPAGTVSGVPTGAFVSVNDLNFSGKGHAARITIGAGAALSPGQIVRLRFQDCQGAAVPPASAFLCTVLSASDPFLNPVSGVHCSAVVE